MQVPTQIRGLTTGLMVLCIAAFVSPAPAADTSDVGTSTATSEGLEEVVVTARRREESLESVPISVSAFGGAELARLQSETIIDLDGVVPNFLAKQNPTTTVSTSLYIRGVGEDESQITAENAVGTYVDGVYLPRAAGALISLLDYESVEVLRGPQGTLFGKNSPGGAVTFNSAAPSLTTSGGHASVSVGSYDLFAGSVSDNVVLQQNIAALKVDFGYKTNNGWMHDLTDGLTTNGTNTWSGRASVELAPADAVAVRLIADVSRDRSEPFLPTYVVGNTYVSGLYNTYIQPAFDHPQHFDGYGLTGLVDYNINPELTLKSISSYRKFQHDLWGDLFGAEAFSVSLYRSTGHTQESQEFQLNYALQKFKFVTGIIYFREDNEEHAYNQFVGNANDGGDLYPITDQVSRSEAVYAEGTYNITDWTSLTVGGRYGGDQKTMTRRATNEPDGTGDIVAYNVVDEKASWTKFTPRVILDFSPLKAFDLDATDTLLTYVSFSNGYKAGGWDPSYSGNQALAQLILGEETVDSYEAGVKTQFFGNRLRLNADYFYNKYDNYQSYNCAFGNQSICIPANFNINLDGYELDVAARPVAGLNIYANAGTLHNKILTGINVGRQLLNSPKLTYAAGAEYAVPVVAGYQAYVGLNYRWSSQYYNDLANGLEGRTPTYSLTDGYIGFAPVDHRWDVRIFGKNLGDTPAVLNALSGGSRWIAQPRNWGIKFDTKF